MTDALDFLIANVNRNLGFEKSAEDFIDMKGKRGLVMGVSNARSLGWAIAERLQAAGAELVVNVSASPYRVGVVALLRPAPERGVYLTGGLTLNAESLTLERVAGSLSPLLGPAVTTRLKKDKTRTGPRFSVLNVAVCPWTRFPTSS